ncbi:Tigger transposable element-derived protein 4 [Mactra antiquata]
MFRNLIGFVFLFVPTSLVSSNELCHYPCQCPVHTLNCDIGVSVVKDGCDCCYMCARQHGDLCNVKDVCDEKLGLFCDKSLGHVPGMGICKANASQPCVVDGVTYQDGEKFKPECSRQCTCQNGNYGCIDLCPDEYRVPSSTHCKSPRLEAVEGRCCKQWACDVQPKRHHSNSGGISPRHINNEIVPMALKSDAKYAQRYYSNYYQNTEPQTSDCKPKYGTWGVCSKSCGVGVSTRMATNSSCQEYQETRLCQLRPCDTRVPATATDKCTPTSRLPGKHHFIYEDCVSMKEWNLKFCTNCKRRRCCYPKSERTRQIEFQCGDGRREVFNVMWIKSCRCDKQCYVQGPRNRKNRRSRG